MLIDPRFVLTAGHCVYAHEDLPDYNPCTGTDTSCWATEILVYPGYENGDMPYGGATNSGLFARSAWISSEDRNNDMGYIRLSRHVGALTSWYGFGWNSDDNFFETNTFHNPGYPAEDGYNGEYMYYWYGSYDSVSDNILLIESANSKGGQSGSGSYNIDSGGNRYVYAVHTHLTAADGEGDRDAGQNRITENKFTNIVNQINTDTPDTFDLVALDVNVTPGAIPEGGSMSSMNYLVHNYSEASYNGSINVGVYMSTNNIISINDTLLQTHSLNLNLGPKSSTRVTLANMPVIPYPTTGITRAIGVVLDVNDANDWNDDSSTWDSAEIDIINCNTPATPSLVSPANWDYTQDRTPFFDWNSVTYADSYRIWVDDALDWASLVINQSTSGSDFTPGSNLADDTYYWAVTAYDTTSGCNIQSAWSEVRALVVDDTNPANPTMWSSTHTSGGWSNSNLITANWSGAYDATSGVQGYGTYWSQGATDTPDATLDTAGNSETSSPLSDGSWYFHLRTVDNAGNWAGAVHLGPFHIDTVAPTAWMIDLPPVQIGNSFQVSWGGSDNAAGVDGYYVMYKVGAGAWTSWLSNTSATSATFGPSSPVTVVPWQTYYFRVAAVDEAGNLGLYSTSTSTYTINSDNDVYLPLVVR